MTRFAETFPTLASASSELVPDALAKPTLRDVQHALALEHGFSGWTELKQKLTAEPKRPRGRSNSSRRWPKRSSRRIAREPPRRWNVTGRCTWHRRNHQAMRTYVQLDLGRQAGAANQNDDITLDDARFLVAREHGFERWDALVKYYTSMQGQSSLVTTKPIRSPHRRDGR